MYVCVNGNVMLDIYTQTKYPKVVSLIKWAIDLDRRRLNTRGGKEIYRMFV